MKTESVLRFVPVLFLFLACFRINKLTLNLELSFTWGTEIKGELDVIFGGSKRAAGFAGGRRGRDLGYTKIYGRTFLSSTIIKINLVRITK